MSHAAMLTLRQGASGQKVRNRSLEQATPTNPPVSGASLANEWLRSTSGYGGCGLREGGPGLREGGGTHTHTHAPWYTVVLLDLP